MTHTLSRTGSWGTTPINVKSFINEGVAVAFSLYDYDRYNVARKSITGKNIHSVLDLWNDNNADAEILYPVGGAFVTYLYKNSTASQFKSIIKNQTVENAIKIYGNEQFNKMIVEFNHMIGFR